jgi:hypothetical protein
MGFVQRGRGGGDRGGFGGRGDRGGRGGRGGGRGMSCPFNFSYIEAQETASVAYILTY